MADDTSSPGRRVVVLLARPGSDDVLVRDGPSGAGPRLPEILAPVDDELLMGTLIGLAGEAVGGRITPMRIMNRSLDAERRATLTILEAEPQALVPTDGLRWDVGRRTSWNARRRGRRHARLVARPRPRRRARAAAGALRVDAAGMVRAGERLDARPDDRGGHAAYGTRRGRLRVAARHRPAGPVGRRAVLPEVRRRDLRARGDDHRRTRRCDARLGPGGGRG